MKVIATEDIAAPIGVVWARVSDLDAFERRMETRVRNLARTPPGPAGAGTSWTARADVMGRARTVVVTLARMEAPVALSAEAGTEGIEVTLTVDLAELAPRRTRLTVTTEARARSLAARLMLQSAKLARKTMARRYKARVAGFAASVATDARQKADRPD